MSESTWALLGGAVVGIGLKVVDWLLSHSERVLARRKDLREEIAELWERQDKMQVQLDTVTTERDRYRSERDQAREELAQLRPLVQQLTDRVAQLETAMREHNIPVPPMRRAGDTEA